MGALTNSFVNVDCHDSALGRAPVVIHVSGGSENCLRVGRTSLRPIELERNILSYLDPLSLCKVCLLSRKFAALSREEFLWKNICLMNNISSGLSGNFKNYKALYARPHRLPYRLRQAYVAGVQSRRGPNVHAATLCFLIASVITAMAFAWKEKLSRILYIQGAKEAEISYQLALIGKNFNRTSAYAECGGEADPACKYMVIMALNALKDEAFSLISSKYSTQSTQEDLLYYPMLSLCSLSIVPIAIYACSKYFSCSLSYKIGRILVTSTALGNLITGSMALSNRLYPVSASLTITNGTVLFANGVLSEKITKKCRNVCGRTSSFCVLISACFRRCMNRLRGNFS